MKKDDYIVVLYNSPNTSFKSNHCYKQRMDYYYLKVEIDSRGIQNGNGIYNDTSENWRYATKFEVDYYDKLGKPYDITTIPDTIDVIVENLEKLEKRYE